MTPIDEFPDNDEVVYEVPMGRVFWKHRPGDVTAPLTQVEKVTKRQVREMFVTFLKSSPELRDKPRDEQIRVVLKGVFNELL